MIISMEKMLQDKIKDLLEINALLEDKISAYESYCTPCGHDAVTTQKKEPQAVCKVYPFKPAVSKD